MTKPYSELSFAVDLIIEKFGLKNPIEISEKIYDELDIDISIHAIADYLDINRQDYEKESQKQYYNTNY